MRARIAGIAALTAHPDPDPGPDLTARLATVRARMAAAAQAAGRDPDAVRLVAVSKGFDAGSLRAATGLGQTVFGENRVQEARSKVEALPGVEWHMVGHLQTNKAAEAAGLFDCVHSVDSLRLARDLSAACVALGRRIEVLVQVDLAGEEFKHGVAPDEAEALVREAARLPGLEVAGLMTIPPWAPEAESARPFFQELVRISSAVRARTGLALPELSMGMSNDFEVAIAEGATLVRVGRAVFGERPA